MVPATLQDLHSWIENNDVYADDDGLQEIAIIKAARQELLIRLQCARYMPTYNHHLHSVKNKKMELLTALLTMAVRYIEGD